MDSLRKDINEMYKTYENRLDTRIKALENNFETSHLNIENIIDNMNKKHSDELTFFEKRLSGVLDEKMFEMKNQSIELDKRSAEVVK